MINRIEKTETDFEVVQPEEHPIEDTEFYKELLKEFQDVYGTDEQENKE